VAVSADIARLDLYKTLDDAASAKYIKHKALGLSFRPFIISAGGLLSKSTSAEYRRLQRLLALGTAAYMDGALSLVLIRMRAQIRNDLETRQSD
jgi:hypothetical protein